MAVGSYFGQSMTSIVERLLGEQMADGGWNCEQENGSTRGSFHTTINVLEGLLEQLESRRNIRRSSRNSCPRSRAAVSSSSRRMRARDRHGLHPVLVPDRLALRRGYAGSTTCAQRT